MEIFIRNSSHINALTLKKSNKEKQLHWKIIHNAIFTEYKLSLMGKSDGKYHFCKIETEYLTHLFYECRVTKDVLKKNSNENKWHSTIKGIQAMFSRLENGYTGCRGKRRMRPNIPKHNFTHP